MNNAIIDTTNPTLSDKEAQALVDMIAKRDQYLSQNRLHEAHGATAVIRIYWNAMIGFEDTMPGTDWASL